MISCPSLVGLAIGITESSTDLATGYTQVRLEGDGWLVSAVNCEDVGKQDDVEHNYVII